MKNIFQKFINKIDEKNINDFCFLYSGKNIDHNIKLKEINNNESEIKIIVSKNELIEEDQFMKSKYIICPRCKKNSVININNYRIYLEECDEGHVTPNVSLENIKEYENTQLIDQSKIICTECNQYKKSNTYQNKFYKCFSCEKDICPLCKSKHDKKHYIVDYDEINFLCNTHANERYISYCKKCRENLCLICELKHNKEHQIISFKDIIPEDNLKIDEFENIFLEFKEDINKIKNIINKVEKNFISYNNMINVIKNNYDTRNRNYQILKSAKNISDYNSKLIIEMKKIINKDRINDKMENIIELYNKIINGNNDYKMNEESNNYYIKSEINNKEDNKTVYLKNKKDYYSNINFTNEITIKYKINDLKAGDKINILGEEFIKNNSKNIEIFINSKKYTTSKSYKLKQVNIDSKSLEVKLKFLKNLNDISYMFKDCSTIVSISDIDRINTSNINNMSYLFYDCNSLESLPDISIWDTSEVTDMKCMFSGCKSLIQIPDISKWNISNVINLSYMFCDCENLIELPDISKWNTTRVKDISGMFSGCSKLSKIPNLEYFDLKNVLNVSYMFNGCKSLSKDDIKLNFPEGVKKDYMF